MPEKKLPAPERVQAAFRQLSTVAKDLNSASDELGKTITELDAALKQLNLGIGAWVVIVANTDEHGNFWNRSIGYTRIGNQWGVALRETSGNENFEDGFQEEAWLFNNAPRWLRIEGVAKIPELFEKLIQQADESTKRIKQKTAEAKELAAAIKSATAEPKKTVSVGSAMGTLADLAGK
jgi:hypothetical protein